jgi:hypothetical protein
MVVCRTQSFLRGRCEIHHGIYSSKALCDSVEKNADVFYKLPGTFANPKDMVATALGISQQNTYLNRDEDHDDLSPTISVTFGPQDESEDDVRAIALLGRITDIVNTAKNMT